MCCSIASDECLDWSLQMAQVTIHHDAGVEVVVVEGSPPVDRDAVSA
jgi:nicotinamidase-related amidase